MPRRVFFRAMSASGGLELWVTDGTAAGTTMLKHIPGSVESYPTGFGYSGDKLLFQVNDGAKGVELWITDGTVDGTMPLEEVDPETTIPDPAGFAQVGDGAVFAAGRDGEGLEPWVTDGTDAATMLLLDLNSGAGTSRHKAGDVPV